jgi:hypothetical protein
VPGLTQVAPTDLDVPVLGQLAPARLPLDDAFEAGSTVDAPLGGEPLREQPLKHAPRHPDQAAVLADLELDGLPRGVLQARDWETVPLALSCLRMRSVEEYAPREAR